MKWRKKEEAMKKHSSWCSCWLGILLYLLVCQSSDGLSVKHLSRRDAVLVSSSATLSVTAVAASTPLPASAADPAEAIRKSASNLPGYGSPDVYYPASWQGLWTMQRDVLFSNEQTLTLTYKVRFLPSSDGLAVQDRGYNQQNLENTLRPDSVQSVDWVASNPNDLRLVFRSGQRKELKVTKRATERTGSDTVTSSEFQRVLQEDERGIPQVSARRVVSQWRQIDEDTLVAQEMVYDVGGGGDPMAMPQTMPKNEILSKSRMKLTRVR